MVWDGFRWEQHYWLPFHWQGFRVSCRCKFSLVKYCLMSARMIWIKLAQSSRNIFGEIYRIVGIAVWKHHMQMILVFYVITRIQCLIFKGILLQSDPRCMRHFLILFWSLTLKPASKKKQNHSMRTRKCRVSCRF